MSKEHRDTTDNARQTTASLKAKLGKELAAKTLELDKCQKDLVILQTRLKVGEINEETYAAKSKNLVEKIESIKKKVEETQNLINTRFAENEQPVIESDEIIKPSLSAGGKQADALSVPGEITELKKTLQSKEGEPEKISKDTAVKETNEPKSEDTEIIKSHRPSLHLHPLHEPAVKNKPASVGENIKNNRIIIIIMAALALILLGWGAISLFVPKYGSGVGNAAPNFVMQLGDNNTSDLNSFRGKSVVLVFWDRDFWDEQFFYVNGVARKLYTPDKLNQLRDKYSHNELEIVAIASGTNDSEIDKLIHDYGIRFPVIVDSIGKLRESYNISYEPTYIFLDKNGIIRARVEGPFINVSDLEQIVYNTSKNVEIKPSTPPITDVIIQAVTEKSATINWSTAMSTTTQVDIDGKNIQTLITPSPQTLHTLVLRDKEPATAYRIRIIYNINNINVSEHSFSALADTIVSKRYLLTTANIDTSYPEIANISTAFITDSSVTITWKTDESATGEVNYSSDKSYSETATQGDKMSIWHTVKIEALKPDTQYYLQLRSKDASGKETSQEIEPIKTQNLIETAPRVGKRAPDFSLYSLNGTQFTLNQFSGYKVLLNFWLEGCSACQEEMPIIQKAFDKYSRDQLIILAVNVYGDPDKVNYYIAKEKFTFPVLMDTQGNVDSVYRSPYFPTSYFIDTKGTIREIVSERFQTISQIDDIVSKLD